MKIKVYLSIGFAGADRDDIIEIDDADLEGLSVNEREKVISENAKMWAENYVEWGWEEL